METIQTSHEQAMRMAPSMYVGYECTGCGHRFSSVEDLEERNPKCSGKDENGIKLACSKCFK